MIALYMVVFCLGNSTDNSGRCMSVLGSPPKCRAFIVILSIMLSNTDKKFSTKTLMAAKDAVKELQEQALDMVGSLTMLDLMNDMTTGLFDKKTIQECFQMMATFNRLMHEQEARLRHLQSMQIADARARRQLGILEKEYAATKSKSVLKN